MITFYEDELIAVPDLGDKLTMSTASDQFRLIEPLVKQYNVAIDLAGVQYVDSAGLGAMVRLFKESKKYKYKVGLVNPQPKVRSLLDLCRVSEIIPVYDSMYAFREICKEELDNLEGV